MLVTNLPNPRLAHLSPEHTETVKATLPVVGESIGTIAKVF